MQSIEQGAAVVFSGGLDSTVALAMAARSFQENGRVYAISFMYDSKHNARELKAANDICYWYHDRGVDILHKIIPLSAVFYEARKVSALMGDEVEMPQATYEEIQNSVGPSPTVVPIRNGVFLMAAASIANACGAKYLFAGMHGGDAHNDHYADCSWPFIEAIRRAILIGTYGEVDLITPFVQEHGSQSKADVCATGILLKAPLHLTWSCYENGPLHCGRCPTCLDRINAFKACGMRDAVEYLDTPRWPESPQEYLSIFDS